jgi:hypothetical protein
MNIDSQIIFQIQNQVQGQVRDQIWDGDSRVRSPVQRQIFHPVHDYLFQVYFETERQIEDPQ